MSAPTRSGPAEHGGAIGEAARMLRGLVRRMAVTRSTSSIWQVLGHVLLDGKPEVRDAETFLGIGFYARAPASGKPEAIAIFGAGAQSPIVIAARDEKTRAAVATLKDGETAIFTDKTMIRIKDDGTVEIAAVGGTPLRLATLQDLQALGAFVQTMTLPVSGATAGPPAPDTVPKPVGTAVLKAQ